MILLWLFVMIILYILFQESLLTWWSRSALVLHKLPFTVNAWRWQSMDQENLEVRHVSLFYWLEGLVQVFQTGTKITKIDSVKWQTLLYSILDSNSIILFQKMEIIFHIFMYHFCRKTYYSTLCNYSNFLNSHFFCKKQVSWFQN